MSHRFVRCPHCKMPHDASERACPVTGRALEPPRPSMARIGDMSNSRMAEVPPPERSPQPLGFVPPVRGAGGSNPPTRTITQNLTGTTVGGRYALRGILGEGGMGTVYDAEHLGLGRFVAIKVLNPSQAKKRVAVKRFQQEARAAGAIGHPNICEVYDMGLLDDGSPYLVMEKLVGQTLADRISREGGLPFDDIAEVMIQVLSGLIAAHEKGIVHRDIKPENIFLARRTGYPPIAKILDFGVSKMMAQFATADDQLDLTRTGMVMGTPYYMSPEQARGERNLDGRVDVYACGVMMYEAIAGKRPFLAPNYNALLLAIINTAPRSLRDVRPATPPQLEQIVRRAMAKARTERYPTAVHLLRDLQTLPFARRDRERDSGGQRVPPPPTAEERKRAPVVGGGRSPAEMLRERISEPRQAVAAKLPKLHDDEDDDDRNHATRLDVRPLPAGSKIARGEGHVIETVDTDDTDDTEDIVDIDLQTPLHGPAPDPEELASLSESNDEMPTEIFRPENVRKNPFLPPRPPPPSPSTRRAPAPAPAPDAMATSRRGGEPVRSLVPIVDEWDGETVVKPPAKRKFNADETEILYDPNRPPTQRRKPRSR